MNSNFSRVLFFVLLVTLLSLKNSLYFIAVLPLLWGAAGSNFIQLNKRVLKSVLFFNLSVSLGYIIVAYIKDITAWEYLLYINVKVYSLTFFVFLFFSRVNVIEFFSFSKELSYLLTISLSQILSYKKSFEDFRLAYKARVVKKLRQRERSFIVYVFEFFMQKALHDSKERTLAMKARGFFD